MNAPHPLHALEHQANALRDIERAGERPESIFIALASVMSFVLPIAVIMMVLAFGAAWLFG